jgi:hypothetical protein
MDHQLPRLSALETLPVELTWEILLALPNVSSLDNLIRASPVCYRAYRSSKDAIIFKVLCTEISPQVLRQAIACYEAFQTQFKSIEEIDNFIDHFFKCGLPPSLPAPVSRKIYCFHEIVEFFTADFCSENLQRNPMTGYPDDNYERPSKTEIIRIQRGLYLFQLYCDLFRLRKNPLGQFGICASTQAYLFLHRLPRWEVQELGCIFSHLYRRLSPVFDQSAVHDSTLITISGHLLRNAGPTPRSADLARDLYEPQYIDHMMCYLSHGLYFLHRLLGLQTLSERTNLLKSHFGHDPDFLGTALAHDLFSRRVEHSEDFSDDPDRPNSAWLSFWSRNEGNPYAAADLWQWGYAMWDKPRLTAWGVLDSFWGIIGSHLWCLRETNRSS